MIDAPPATLVSACRIGEAIANDPLAARQCGPDQILNMNAARGKHQQCLGDRRELLATPFENDLTHALGERGTPRLSRQTRGNRTSRQPLANNASDRRFSRALYSFERDEATRGHRAWVRRCWR